MDTKNVFCLWNGSNTKGKQIVCCLQLVTLFDKVCRALGNAVEISKVVQLFCGLHQTLEQLSSYTISSLILAFCVQSITGQEMVF